MVSYFNLRSTKIYGLEEKFTLYEAYLHKRQWIKDPIACEFDVTTFHERFYDPYKVRDKMDKYFDVNGISEN